MKVKTLLLAALTLGLLSSSAIAKDVFPYKADGKKRDWYLQTTIRACQRDPYWTRLGTDKEVLDFCNCKSLYLADILTEQDVADQYRAMSVHASFPASLTDKWQASYTACQGRFGELPSVPKREEGPAREGPAN